MNAHVAPETRALIKGMMKSSKLSNAQQMYMESLIDSHGSLPETAVRGLATTKNKTANPNIRDVKAAEEHLRVSRTRDWYYSGSGIRTRESIEMVGGYVVDKYRPKPTKNYEREKTKLQNGTDLEPIQYFCSSSISMLEKDEELDEKRMLIGEIQERKLWISEMAAIGSKKYGVQVQLEIEERMSRIRQLESQR